MASIAAGAALLINNIRREALFLARAIDVLYGWKKKK